MLLRAHPVALYNGRGRASGMGPPRRAARWGAPQGVGSRRIGWMTVLVETGWKGLLRWGWWGETDRPASRFTALLPA